MSNNQNTTDNQQVSQLDEDTFIVTSEKLARESLEQAVYDFQNKSNFRSTFLNEGSGMVNFKIEDIDNLAYNAQSNLLNIIKINNIVKYFVNKNDLLGRVYESLESNVNSEYELTYPNFNEDEKDTYEIVKNIIKDFNEKINIKELITTSIPMAYLEGNYPIYLRKDSKNNNYQVDHYPLGVCEVADYSEGDEPYLLINVKELESRLRKIYRKNKKNQALFYKDMTEEIKATYPKEVYQAHINKEQFAILNIRNSGVIRVNNLKRKYGLTPIFKALKPVIRIENIELSDDKNTLVRGKKIIFQKLSKELFTQTDIKNITWLSAQAKAHSDLVASMNNNGSVTLYTGTPWVESVQFTEPKLEQTNVQIKKDYREQILTSVGISHLSPDANSFGSSKISISELMKVINRISEQLETIIKKWYKGLLVDNGIDVKYCPNIKVMDSELLEKELKVSFATFLFDKLGASYQTAFEILGKDYQTEKMRRIQENEDNVDGIFFPRINAHTVSGKNNPNSDNDNKAGRPSTNQDLDQKEFDKNYNEENDR